MFKITAVGGGVCQGPAPASGADLGRLIEKGVFVQGLASLRKEIAQFASASCLF